MLYLYGTPTTGTDRWGYHNLSAIAKALAIGPAYISWDTALLCFPALRLH